MPKAHLYDYIQGIKPTNSYTDAQRRIGARRLSWAVGITGIMMIVEVIGGIFTHSLALISDAGHMLTHFFSLLMALFAIYLTQRPATKQRTYGFYRAEILAAFINSIFLVFVSMFLVWKSLWRIFHLQEILAREMFIIAFLGLVANGLSFWLLFDVRKKDINIRSAFLHVLGDLFSSLVIVLGAVFIQYTDNHILDPILGIFICVLILIWAARLIKESVEILLEATPKGINLDKLVGLIKENIPEVKLIHDVHVWVITSHMFAMTAHILIDDCLVSKSQVILEKINKFVAENFGIGHTNIQFESSVGECH